VNLSIHTSFHTPQNFETFTKFHTSPRTSFLTVSLHIMALQVFHLFPKLPAELRLKVWYHTLPGPRELKPKWTSQRNPHSMRLYQQFQQLSGSPVSQERTGGPQVADPIALRINRESRDLALTYYERRSGTLEPGEGYYIDFKIDSLHFNISFHPRQIFPRIVNRTYYDNGVLRSFDTTWIRYEWNNGACGPGIDPTDEMKRTRAVTICSDCFKNWTGSGCATGTSFSRIWRSSI
jgi:hypothetical protein